MYRPFWRSVALCGLLVLGIVCCSVPPAAAQQTLGTIAGSVMDSSASLIPGTQVTLTSEQTGFTRTVQSNGNGEYQLLNLAIGSYTLIFTHDGFETAKFPGIAVQENRVTTLNATLKTGSVATSITVNETPLLNATDTTNGYILDSAQIENVPLATGSFTQLAILAPGVSAELLSGTGTNAGLGNQPIWANGQRDTSNTFQFNGVDTSNLFNGKSTSEVASGRVVPNTGENFAAGGVIVTNTSVYDAIGQSLPTPAPESIQEIRVNTSMYDAQQGSTSGAHIDLSTKSGTNEIHGQSYLYRATDWLNADPFFYKDQTPVLPVPQLHRYTAGATFGAPIIKDKLFGFLSYQYQHVADQQNGISQLFVAPDLTDARDANSLAAVAQKDFGKTVNPANIDPAALSLFNFKLPNGQYLIPSSQQPGVDAPGNNVNVTELGQPLFVANQATANIDYNLSKKDILAAKYFYQHDPSLAPFGASAVNGFEQHLDTGAHVASLTNAIAVSPRFNWTQSMGFVREKAYSFDDQPLTPATVGINLFGFSTFPGLSIGNFSGLGTQNINTKSGLNIGPTGTFDRTGVFQNRWAPSSNAIWSLGRHSITVGTNYGYTQLNVRNNRTETASLAFTEFDTFLTGTEETGTKSTLLLGAASRYYRSNQVGSYAQDKWQAMPNLSITAGIRYDWDGPLTEKYGNLFNFDPNLYSYNAGSDTIVNDGFIIAGNNKQFPTAGVSDSTLKGRQWGISPRIGVAWSPSRFQGKVVVRTGVGLYYDRGELFTYLSPGAGGGTSGPFGVTQEPPFVIPQSAPKGGTLSQPFGATEPAVPNGNPATFTTYLSNAAGIINGNQTFAFGSYAINNKLPYTENLSFDIQWQPLNDLAVTLGYVGNRGRHGVIPVPFNQPGLASQTNPINGQTSNYGYQVTDINGNNLVDEPIDTFDGGNTDLRVPFLGYSINSVSYQAAGNSAYDALQAHLEKRLTHGIQVGASYTYSHSLDEQSALGLFYNGNNPLNLRSGYASSDFDRTHILNFYYTYQLRKFGSDSSLLGRFTNGWQLSGITVVQSGQPYSVEDFSGAAGSLFYGNSDGITNPILPLAPGFTAKTAKTGHSGGFVDAAGDDLALNPAAFAAPIVAVGTNGVPACGPTTGGVQNVCDVYETTFGTGQRNIFRQAFQKRADISLIKATRFTDRISGRYTFDVYNLTNTTSFDIPGNSIGIGQGSGNSSSNGTSLNFGQVAYDPTLTNVSASGTVPACNNVTACNIATEYSPLTKANNQGLGKVVDTIGGPRNIQMSFHLIF
jgi:Carboxypeptidase regulatory-like domain